MAIPSIQIAIPSWVDETVARSDRYVSQDDRMALAIELAHQNVIRGNGGPFGAAVFERDTGRLVGAGVNLVTSLDNSVLHAEVVALMTAEARLASYTLGSSEMPVHEIVTSCEPCAMCLGAVLWSGVRHVVYGATADDARALGFDEGPVFPASYEYLDRRGIEVVRNVRHEEAREVLRLYRDRGGTIYNG